MATAYTDHPKALGTMYSLGVFFPQNSSAIENLCGRFRHRKRSQNVVGRTHTQFVIIYKIIIFPKGDVMKKNDSQVGIYRNAHWVEIMH
jgi:hypothetical protein